MKNLLYDISKEEWVLLDDNKNEVARSQNKQYLLDTHSKIMKTIKKIKKNPEMNKKLLGGSENK